MLIITQLAHPVKTVSGNRFPVKVRPRASLSLIPEGPALIPGEDSLDGGEEILGGELLVGAAGGPGDSEPDVALVLEPVGDLLDGGALEVVGKWCLACGWRGAGEDVAAGVGEAGS